MSSQSGRESQEPQARKAKPEQNPPYVPSPRVVVEEDIVFGLGGGRELRLNLYRPHDDRSFGQRSGWVFVHGGGWRSGNRLAWRRQATHFAETLNAVGVSVEYRLVEEAPFPAALEDVKCAVRWLRVHAADYGIDPEKIGIAGGSAGGHLAAMVGTTWNKGLFEGTGGHADRSSRVFGMMLANPVLDLADVVRQGAGGKTAVERFMATSLDADPQRYADASPITHVDEATPPALLMHVTADRTIPLNQSVAFRDRLCALGIPARLFAAEDAPHGFFNNTPWYERCLTEMTHFARELDTKGSLHAQAT